jgi:hypothetical protein
MKKIEGTLMIENDYWGMFGNGVMKCKRYDLKKVTVF